jgi:hypothetical protein
VRNPSFRLPVSAALASIDGPSAVSRTASIHLRAVAGHHRRTRPRAGRTFAVTEFSPTARVTSLVAEATVSARHTSPCAFSFCGFWWWAGSVGCAGLVQLAHQRQCPNKTSTCAQCMPQAALYYLINSR